MTLSPTDFPGIYVESNWQKGITDGLGRHMYYASVHKALAKIASYQLGGELLDLIAKRHAQIGTSERGLQRSVTIRPNAAGKEGASAAGWVEANKYHRTLKLTGGTTISAAGKGTRSIIYIPCDSTSDAMFTRLAGVNTPTWIALAHELIHALHQLSGTAYKEEISVVGKGSVKREEMFTTGIGPYANTRLSENAIRTEAGLPLRPHYYFPGDVVHVKALSSTPESGELRRYWTCAVLQQVSEFG